MHSMQLTMSWLAYPFFSSKALFLFVFLITIGIGIGIGTGIGRKKEGEYYGKLPPSPPPLPILGNLLWFLPNFDLGPTLRRLRLLLGPIATLHIPLLPPCIFIMDRDLAHRTLIRHAAAFSHRPPRHSGRAFRIHAHSINTAPYGPRWRRNRHALGVDLLNPSRLASFSHAHRRALGSLVQKLQESSGSGVNTVDASESFHFATYHALTLICFGEKLDDSTVRRLRALQLDYLSLTVKLAAYSLLPSVAMVLYLNRWRRALHLSRKIDELLLPLFRAREQVEEDPPSFVSYLDLLLELDLDDDEMVSLCMEFLNAGVDTTATALEWIMVHLAKNQEMQEKLYQEIKTTTSQGGDVQKIPYLKAVLLEALRRHPPAHVSLPHMAGETVEVDGYVIPKGAIVNYALSEINWDEKVWEEPMEFRPERFLGGEADIDSNATLTNGAEIKMMPFGAGRRMCPAGGLAMMQVGSFVASLISKFRWEVAEGVEVELEEKHGLITTVKNPFKARIVSRE